MLPVSYLKSTHFSKIAGIRVLNILKWLISNYKYIKILRIGIAIYLDQSYIYIHSTSIYIYMIIYVCMHLLTIIWLSLRLSSLVGPQPPGVCRFLRQLVPTAPSAPKPQSNGRGFFRRWDGVAGARMVEIGWFDLVLWMWFEHEPKHPRYPRS